MARSSPLPARRARRRERDVHPAPLPGAGRAPRTRPARPFLAQHRRGCARCGTNPAITNRNHTGSLSSHSRGQGFDPLGSTGKPKGLAAMRDPSAFWPRRGNGAKTGGDRRPDTAVQYDQAAAQHAGLGRARRGVRVHRGAPPRRRAYGRSPGSQVSLRISCHAALPTRQRTMNGPRSAFGGSTARSGAIPRRR